MTNQNAVAQVADWFADNGGLLAPVVGKVAAKALTDLVGGLVGIPAAYLERIATGIRTDGEAKTRIKLKLADEVSERVAKDPAILDRMAERWIGDELEKQSRREKVARLAAEDLASSPPEADIELAPDFIPRLSSYAEQAASDDLQALFARILAGEIRKPGTYSLAALHVLSIMDHQLACQVEEVSSWILIDFIPFEKEFTQSPHLDTIGNLEDLGLLRGGLIRKFKVDGGSGVFAFDDVNGGRPALIVKSNKDILEVSAVLVTPLGSQIFGLVESRYSDESVRLVAEALLAQDGIESVKLANTKARAGGGVGVETTSAVDFTPPLDS